MEERVRTLMIKNPTSVMLGEVKRNMKCVVGEKNLNKRQEKKMFACNKRFQHHDSSLHILGPFSLFIGHICFSLNCTKKSFNLPSCLWDSPLNKWEKFDFILYLFYHFIWSIYLNICRFFYIMHPFPYKFIESIRALSN